MVPATVRVGDRAWMAARILGSEDCDAGRGDVSARVELEKEPVVKVLRRMERRALRSERGVVSIDPVGAFRKSESATRYLWRIDKSGGDCGSKAVRPRTKILKDRSVRVGGAWERVDCRCLVTVQSCRELLDVVQEMAVST